MNTITKTVSTTTLRANVSDVIDEVSQLQTPMFVKRHGKVEAVILDVASFEDYLAAQDPEYLAAIKQSRNQIKKGDVFSAEQVFGEI